MPLGLHWKPRFPHLREMECLARSHARWHMPLIPAPGGIIPVGQPGLRRDKSQKHPVWRCLGCWGGQELLRAALSDQCLPFLSEGFPLQNAPQPGLPAQPCWPVCRGLRTRPASTWPAPARAWICASVSEPSAAPRDWLSLGFCKGWLSPSQSEVFLWNFYSRES